MSEDRMEGKSRARVLSSTFQILCDPGRIMGSGYGHRILGVDAKELSVSISVSRSYEQGVNEIGLWVQGSVWGDGLRDGNGNGNGRWAMNWSFPESIL